MKKLLIYVDASVIGGCEDLELAEDSKEIWQQFVGGRHILVLSAHTLRELQGASESVRQHLLEVPKEYQILLEDTQEAAELAEAYLKRGILGEGSRADAIHVALATMARADVLISWNFKHIVNLNRIRLFHSVNIELGYSAIEIRSPKEVLQYE